MQISPKSGAGRRQRIARRRKLARANSASNIADDLPVLKAQEAVPGVSARAELPTSSPLSSSSDSLANSSGGGGGDDDTARKGSRRITAVAPRRMQSMPAEANNSKSAASRVQPVFSKQQRQRRVRRALTRSDSHRQKIKDSDALDDGGHSTAPVGGWSATVVADDDAQAPTTTTLAASARTRRRKNKGFATTSRLRKFLPTEDADEDEDEDVTVGSVTKVVRAGHGRGRGTGTVVKDSASTAAAPAELTVQPLFAQSSQRRRGRRVVRARRRAPASAPSPKHQHNLSEFGLLVDDADAAML